MIQRDALYWRKKLDELNKQLTEDDLRDDVRLKLEGWKAYYEDELQLAIDYWISSNKIKVEDKPLN